MARKTPGKRHSLHLMYGVRQPSPTLRVLECNAIHECRDPRSGTARRCLSLQDANFVITFVILVTSGAMKEFR
ncbi:hypothetical protein CEXT_321411 [Caerostris extrusa]|uniref:Uncharacterized protein n=1 Tax=Caerostris extrusa TaxID=172846 RepID=A0AAV4X325_CAEEX|nr:hypothetical protein CEXT_321411 [Caerostris extrusa]